jgi:hypothetical protein
VEHDPQVSLVDSFPGPVCRFARAPRVRRLREQSAYGYDEMARQTFFGLRAHLRICWPGVIVGLCLTPANVHDLAGAQELLEQQHGFVLADRNYWPTATTGRPQLLVAPAAALLAGAGPAPAGPVQVRQA